MSSNVSSTTGPWQGPQLVTAVLLCRSRPPPRTRPVNTGTIMRVERRITYAQLTGPVRLTLTAQSNSLKDRNCKSAGRSVSMDQRTLGQEAAAALHEPDAGSRRCGLPAIISA
eukprot:GHUV01022067.1.p1 GENE.GHUV01022067.1~~GHUV01022067.1.p1  ORF type:complete len:113 (+),score=15.99 GHUV01022067.1:250-588(+)